MHTTTDRPQINVVRRFTANRNIEDMLRRLFRAHYNMT